MIRLRGLWSRDVGLLVLALAVIAGLAILRERRSAGNPVTYSSYDASGGGYRAWFELLQREGIAASRFEERAAFLDASTGLLVVSDEPGSAAALAAIGPTEISALAEWIRRGGRIIVLGDDALVRLLRPALHLPETASDRGGAGRRVAPELAAAGVVRVPAVTSERLIPRSTDRILVSDRRGALIVSYFLGKGTIVDAIDAAAFANDAIAQPDRARLAVALITIAGTHAQVAFDETVHGYLVPEHWWTALPRRLVVAIIGALLVVGLALAGAAIRLGPPLPAPPSSEAQPWSYLDALATLYERARARHKVLSDAWRSTQRLIARGLGLADGVAAHDLAARMPSAELRGALADFERVAHAPTADDAGLVQGLQLAHGLRREFGSYGRGD